MTSQENFIAAIKDAAIASAAISKIPASFTIAEAALESAWGSSLLATKGHNLFGVKADKAWTGDTLSIRTREYYTGRWVFVDALWRKYPDWFGSITDHAKFLTTNKRYATAFLAKNVEDFTAAIAKAGYATDPLYAHKILSVIRANKLEVLDVIR